MPDEAVSDGETGDSSVHQFSQSNPAGPDRGNVAALLRRVAASLDELGDVDVQDLVFHSEVTDQEDDLTVTVYFYPQPRRR